MSLSIAVAQPGCVACDVEANVRTHAHAIRRARTRVVVFPELSLTGYELEADAVSPDDDALAPLVGACEASDCVAFVGAPLREPDGRELIATLQVSAAGVAAVYRKMWLGGDEPHRFSPGADPVAVAVDGWRLGLGICKDTGVEEHARVTTVLGIDVYVAGMVHLPDELDEQEARAVRIAHSTGAHVALASCAGPTGGGFDRTAGHSGIWSPSAVVLAKAGTATGEIARATIG